MKYLFQLGHQPHISTAELDAVFLHKHIRTSAHTHVGTYLILESNDLRDSQKLLEQLGGTIKIGKEIDLHKSAEQSISDFLHEKTEGKIHFSISGDNAKTAALAVKKNLKSLGKSVRFIEPKNTATILHNNLIEKKGDFTIVGKDVFVTVAIQDIEEFTKRDFDRPGSDSFSGMIPPKLARIMINLAQVDHNSIILDPFCGSGTVLTEALSMGYTNLIGSDISEKAIADTKKNIEWLQSNFKSLDPDLGFQISNFKLFISPAQSINKIISKPGIEAIITEPYLGKPLKGNETRSQLEKQAEELKQLYIDSFKSFKQALKLKGVIVFIFPKFKYKDEWISTFPREQLKQEGFSIQPLNKDNESLLYHRPKQHLGREIHRLIKK
ncbi:MAG: DNA methyltransferase [Candidatus Magasanikbacteria bacterium]